MTKLLLATAALAALVASPALAADIRQPPPPAYKAAPPPVLAVYNWSGCYFGGHAGGLFATKEWTSRRRRPRQP